MPEFEISIPGPDQVFGVVSAEAARQIAGIAVDVHPYEDDAFYTMYDKGSVFGLKIFMPVWFKGRDNPRTLPPECIGNKNIKLECVIIEVSQNKRIILSDVNGMDGAVVEFISNQNYQINFSVLIGGDKNGYPLNAVSELQTWLNQPFPFEVHNALLNRLGISDVVCTNYIISPSPGFENIQKFEIQCISDGAVELKLNPNV